MAGRFRGRPNRLCTGPRVRFVVLVIGHRGCAEQYPENTIEAVQECAPHVDVIEIDVVRCGSGELIAFHDETLERVTGVDAPVDGTDWATIRELDVFDTGASVPRLSALLDRWPDGVGLNLDVHRTGIAPEALQVASGVDDLLLSTTSEAVLRECDDADVDARTGYSFLADPAENVRRAASLGCDFVHVPYRLCLETGLVALAHEAGLSVDAWTVRSAETVEELRDVGVDAVTVDRWDVV